MSKKNQQPRQGQTPKAPDPDASIGARAAIQGDISSISTKDPEQQHTHVQRQKIDVGPNVFDAIEGMSSVGQITAYRALANGGICGAVFAMNDCITLEKDGKDQDIDKAKEARQRAVQQVEMYLYANDQLNTLAMTDFDKAMDLEAALDFASKNASAQRELTELPDEVLKMLGIARTDLAAIDAIEQRKQAKRDADLRASLRDNERQLRAELEGLVDLGYEKDGNGQALFVDQLNAQQYLGLFSKLSKKLSAKMRQVLGVRDRYDGAIGDAMLLSADIRELDKQYIAFARRNKGETREQADA
jgi:hypothetical protein